jgi:hypothetical protein
MVGMQERYGGIIVAALLERAKRRLTHTLSMCYCLLKNKKGEL